MTIQEILKNGNYHLIDVREPSELMMEGQIEGAKNIPMSTFLNQIDEIKEMKGPKILFCRSGGRAQNAVQYLQNNGFEDLHNGGGFMMLNYMLQDAK